MEFAEFRSAHDKYGAYDSWVTVGEAKEQRMIPEKYWDFFPNVCECGSENIISSNLKRCTCCSPRCYVKEACKLAEMLKRLGFKGFGQATCTTVLNSLHAEDAYRRRMIEQDPGCGLKPLFTYGSYVECFSVPFEDYPAQLRNLHIGVEFFQASMKAASTQLTFPQLISCLSIETLGNSAGTLLSGIGSFKELVQKINECGGLRNFCAARGVYAPQLLNSLYGSLQEIGIADCIFRKSLRREGLSRIDLCITGRMTLDGCVLTKNAFIDRLHSLCVDRDGVQLFEFRLGKARETSPFIVYSKTSGSASFNAGKRRGRVEDQFGEHPVLITADDMYALVKKYMEDWDSRLSGLPADIDCKE